jgi:hypothetical protein
MNGKQSLIGGAIAFVLATACCWLPALLVLLGGATGWMAFSESLEQFSGLFMILGAVLVGYGIFKMYSRKKHSEVKKMVVLQSILTCPNCSHQKEETMPTDSCAFFYQCESCKANLKPKEGDCCVYCSYGSVPCPPIQKDEGCC